MENYGYSIGHAGEEAAARYLESLGHRILHRGWRTGRLEVDIISETEECLHFVEVKTRTDPECNPAESIGRAKRLNMYKAARAYLAAFPTGKESRFDAVSVSLGGKGGVIIEYIEDAFMPFF